MLGPVLRFAVLAAMLFPFLLQANPIKDPKRVVNAQTVDLKPLFAWWNTTEASGR